MGFDIRRGTHLEGAVFGEHALDLVHEGHLGPAVRAAKVRQAHGAVAVLGQRQRRDPLSHHVRRVHHHVEATHLRQARESQGRSAYGSMRVAREVGIREHASRKGGRHTGACESQGRSAYRSMQVASEVGIQERERDELQQC